MLAKPLPQFPVARIAPNQVLPGSPETRYCSAKRRSSCVRSFAGLAATSQKRILRRSRHIILNLHHQRRHQIEVLMNVRKLVQQLHHAVIVFERVQPHPGQAIFAGDQILVERLVLVPEKDDAQGRHGWKTKSSMRDSD